MDKEQKRLETRLKYLIQNKVKHLAPTISPAPYHGNDIESLVSAGIYYKSYGVDEVFVQPKLMGSYVGITLYREPGSDVVSSRNGYPLPFDQLTIDKLVTPLRRIFKGFPRSTSMVHLQGELLPWSALGKGLIEDVYETYYYIKKKYSYLLDVNFYKLEEHISSKGYIDYLQDKEQPSHIKTFYKGIHQYITEILPQYADYKEGLPIFRKTLDKFNSNTEPYIRLFNIYGKRNRVENPVHVDATFTSPLSYLPLKHTTHHDWVYITTSRLSNPSRHSEELKALWDSQDEGVIVRPSYHHVHNIKDIVPALKVRNKEYLSMIYGLDFIRNFDQYKANRRIARKLEMSRKQSEAGYRMFINPIGSSEYRKAYWDFVKTEHRVNVDPNL